MDTFVKQLLIRFLIYAGIWLGMTQINGLTAIGAIHIPILWIFVYVASLHRHREVGLAIVVIFGIFFENQFTAFRGFLLPLAVVLFLLIQYRNEKVVDTSYGSHFIQASIVHWVLCVVPTLALYIGSSHDHDMSRIWTRTVLDGVAGQLLLVLLLPVVFIGSRWFERGRLGFSAEKKVSIEL